MDDIDGCDGRKPPRVRGKRGVFIVLGSVLLLMLLVPLSYYYVIPRSEVTITTVYHEISGSGTVGVIMVATRVENTGTLRASDIRMEVVVVNGTYSDMGHYNMSRDLMRPRTRAEDSMSFTGSHYSDYHITIRISFTAGQQRVDQVITHSVIESERPEMNIIWRDVIR